ncbi:MAG: hypothetical protein ABI440_05270 [Casimicrobiaceae bacterium]
MLADIPAVFLGDRASRKLPVRLIHTVAATALAIIGILVLTSAHTGLTVGAIK